jgi:hypothetical protein
MEENLRLPAVGVYSECLKFKGEGRSSSNEKHPMSRHDREERIADN